MKKIITAGLIIFALFSFGAAFAGEPAKKAFTPLEPIMPLAQVKPGMRAQVKTVLEGTKIYQFDATLIGVVRRAASPKNLIVIRIDDKLVLDSGGIAAGMSGSPVYVGGRLVGAIGFGWPFGDNSLGLVTPIEEMIKAMDWPDKIPEFGVSPAVQGDPSSARAASMDAEPESPLSPDLKAGSSDDEKVSDDIFFIEPEKIKEAVPPGSSDAVPDSAHGGLPAYTGPESGDAADGEGALAGFPADIGEGAEKLFGAELTPLAMPLLVDGISPRMAERMKGVLGVEVIPLGAASGGGVNFKAAPKPGAAIGAALAWGDFLAGGIGTLTALDKDGRFLAFAHEMSNRGAVAYAATEAEIIRVIPSLNTPFKLGHHGAIIGTVTQDRATAIGGRLGRFAPAAGYTVRFHDVDTGRKIVKRFQTVADPFVGPALGTTGMLGIIDDLWARVGEGTAILKYKFSGGHLVRGWTRTNTYFSASDIVGEMSREFEALSKIFTLNQFQEIRPFGVELDVEITRDPRVVYIEKIKIADEKDSYLPGDTIDLEVTLRPWRKRAAVKRLSLKVPDNAMGLCEIVVRGGGIEELGQESVMAGYRAITNLGDLIKELNAEESNNQLILEIKSDGDLFAPRKSKSKKEASPGKESDNEEKDSGRQTAEDFLDDRMKSEIIEERVKDQTMLIIDTNYYVEGLLRKLITIGGKEKNFVGALTENERQGEESESATGGDTVEEKKPASRKAGLILSDPNRDVPPSFAPVLQNRNGAR